MQTSMTRQTLEEIDEIRHPTCCLDDYSDDAEVRVNRFVDADCRDHCYDCCRC